MLRLSTKLAVAAALLIGVATLVWVRGPELWASLAGAVFGWLCVWAFAMGMLVTISRGLAFHGRRGRWFFERWIEAIAERLFEAMIVIFPVIGILLAILGLVRGPLPGPG